MDRGRFDTVNSIGAGPSHSATIDIDESPLIRCTGSSARPTVRGDVMNADGIAHRVVMKSLPAVAAAGEQPDTSGRVVYCVPAAGTGARSFLVSFARSPLRGCLRVAQLPGREDRLAEPCMDDILEMAELVADTIVADGVDDYALFGHSFGSLVMWEAARLLEKREVAAPAVLAVAACPAPVASSSLELHMVRPADLAEEWRLAGRLDLSDPLADELAALVLPTLAADCAAVARYLDGSAREPVAVPILAMSGQLDASAPPEKLALWRGCTRSDFTLREYDGTHFFPLESDQPLRTVLDWPRLTPPTG